MKDTALDQRATILVVDPDRDRRARELDAARDAHRAEIEDAQAWAGEVAHRTPALDGLIERFRGPSPTPARP